MLTFTIVALLLFRAVIRPQRAETICRDLAGRDWVQELHAIEIEGSGTQDDSARDPEISARIDVLPRVLVGGLIDDGHRAELVDLICRTCRANRSGDGKVFLFRPARIVEY